jgi:hypothetical protein
MSVSAMETAEPTSPPTACPANSPTTDSPTEATAPSAASARERCVVDRAAAEEVKEDPRLGEQPPDELLVGLLELGHVLPLGVGPRELPARGDARFEQDRGDDVGDTHLLEDPRPLLALEEPEARDDADQVLDRMIGVVRLDDAHGGDDAVEGARLGTRVEEQRGARREGLLLDDLGAQLGRGHEVE